MLCVVDDEVMNINTSFVSYIAPGCSRGIVLFLQSLPGAGNI